MKKLFYCILYAALLPMLALTGCSDTPESRISEKGIIRQFNDALKDSAKNVVFTVLPIGTFEADNSRRLTLRQLQAAGLVEYKVTRYAWWEKTDYTFEDHYVVNLALTPAGQKAVIDIPVPSPYSDKDLKEPSVDSSTYKWNQVDLSENWPEIKNPFLEMKVEEEVVEADTEAVAQINNETDKVSDAFKSNKANCNTERVDSTQYLAYQKVNLNFDKVCVKLAEREAFKVRKIQMFTDGEGITRARAEILLKYRKVNDFGRILKGLENDIRYSVPVNLVYYVDKGWVIEKAFVPVP